MILVLSGTKDGREIVESLNRQGIPLIATTVTKYGKGLITKDNKVDVLDGGLNASGLEKLIQEKEIKLVIDATHPFAQQVSKMAIDICKSSNCEYLRYEREEADYTRDENLIIVDSFSQAAQQASGFAGKIFLTVGSNNLQYFCQKIPVERLVARVLPLVSVIKKCEELGFNPGNIAAVQGPFSKALNREMFFHYHASVVVTKESGNTGGVKEKLEAARELDIPVIMIKRPVLAYGHTVRILEDVLQVVKRVSHKEA